MHGGFIEVSNDNVTVLSDVAELPNSIDVERAEEAKRRCEELLAAEPDDFVAAAALERANFRRRPPPSRSRWSCDSAVRSARTKQLLSRCARRLRRGRALRRRERRHRAHPG